MAAVAGAWKPTPCHIPREKGNERHPERMYDGGNVVASPSLLQLAVVMFMEVQHARDKARRAGTTPFVQGNLGSQPEQGVHFAKQDALSG